MSAAEELVENVEEIRSWLKKNVPNARQDKETIQKFLSGCKHNVEKTKTKMKNFYSVRKTTPELFQGRDPFSKNIDALLTLGAFVPLPVKPPQGHSLVLVKAALNDPKIIPMADVFKVGVMSVDLLMELDQGLTQNGVGVIIDLRGVGLHHALQMTPTLIRKMVHLWQDCYPIRIHGIDFVNAPQGVDLVLNIFRRFLKQNLQERLRTHGSQMESLHAAVGPEFLPEEYGGSLEPESSAVEGWKRKVQTYRRWFLDDDTLK